jgi:anti-sigma factor RsiW
MTRSITCRELIDFLWRYVEEEASEEEKGEFEYHLARCPSCVAYMNTYRQTVALGRAAYEGPDDAVPEDVPEELVAAIVAARRRSAHPGGLPA